MFKRMIISFNTRNAIKNLLEMFDDAKCKTLLKDFFNGKGKTYNDLVDASDVDAAIQILKKFEPAQSLAEKIVQGGAEIRCNFYHDIAELQSKSSGTSKDSNFNKLVSYINPCFTDGRLQEGGLNNLTLNKIVTKAKAYLKVTNTPDEKIDNTVDVEHRIKSRKNRIHVIDKAKNGRPSDMVKIFIAAVLMCLRPPLPTAPKPLLESKSSTEKQNKNN